MGFWSRDVVQTTPSGIEVKDLPLDRPDFKRRYSVRINREISMKIEMKKGYSDYLYTTGELDQSNGRWVLFEPERPADKILDREILPAVQKFCEEILTIDAAFRRSDPNEFVDDAGVKWRRVE